MCEYKTSLYYKAIGAGHEKIETEKKGCNYLFNFKKIKR